MVLLAPFGPPDPITGYKEILYDAPVKKWTGFLIRGRDGNLYDFVDEESCERAAFIVREKFSEDPDPDRPWMMHWWARAKCIRDDGRRQVLFISY